MVIRQAYSTNVRKIFHITFFIKTNYPPYSPKIKHWYIFESNVRWRHPYWYRKFPRARWSSTSKRKTMPCL